MERGEQVAILALEDGAIFYGHPFGARAAFARGRRGEVVFNTAMTGYQEICTDPSYRGQMVVLTYPLIGNYGVTAADAESRRPWLSALLVREHCDEYSNWRATESLGDYLARNGIPGVCELDTRALTRHLRTYGLLRGVLRSFSANETPDLEALVVEVQAVASVSQLDVVGEVSTPDEHSWEAPALPLDAPRIALIDTGFKRNIARSLAERSLDVTIVPHDVDSAWLRKFAPDGVLLANGPGDPESVATLIELTRTLLDGRIPLMGVCLGHQILALAAGARTSRLPFGHHGANHPVREERTGRVTITSQNHNFRVEAASLPAASGFYVSHVNLSDGSVEGLAHEALPIFSAQFHPEASPGPEDNQYLFDQFADYARQHRAARRRPLARVS